MERRGVGATFAVSQSELDTYCDLLCSNKDAIHLHRTEASVFKRRVTGKLKCYVSKINPSQRVDE